MKKLHYLAVFALSLMLLLSITPTLAQTIVDTQLVDTVKAALDNTLAATSLTITVASKTEMADATSATPAQESTRSYQLAAAATGWNLAGTQTTMRTLSMNGTDTTETTALELVILDGVTYVHFIQIPEMLAQQGITLDWTKVDPQQPGALMFAGIAADGSLPIAARGALALPVTVTSVTAISELAADTIDGQAMRVFQLTLDPAAVAASEAASLLNANRGGGLGGPGGQPPAGDANGQPPAGGPGGDANGQPPAGGPGGQPPGSDANGQPPAMPTGDVNGQPPAPPFIADNAQLVVTIWVGADNLVHRLSSVVTLTPSSEANGPAFAGSTTTTVTDYAHFNEALTIALPAGVTP